jgi:hypothetical protein
MPLLDHLLHYSAFVIVKLNEIAVLFEWDKIPQPAYTVFIVGSSIADGV